MKESIKNDFEIYMSNALEQFLQEFTDKHGSLSNPVTTFLEKYNELEIYSPGMIQKRV